MFRSSGNTTVRKAVWLRFWKAASDAAGKSPSGRLLLGVRSVVARGLQRLYPPGELIEHGVCALVQMLDFIELFLTAFNGQKVGQQNMSRGPDGRHLQLHRMETQLLDGARGPYPAIADKGD